MKFTKLFSLLGCIGLVAGCVPAVFAQSSEDEVVIAPKARYAVVPAHPGGPSTSATTASTSLPTWNGSFTYNSTSYTYNMVGASPFSTNSATTIPVVIIPVKIVITSRTGRKTTYDPAQVLSNGRTVVANTVASPIFDSTTTYTQGSVNVGTTQYIDAFQRANFWGTVQTNSNYHLLLGPTVLAEQTLSPPKTYGKTGSVFGFTAGLVDINWFDTQANSLITSLGITANEFPIFLTYDVYLTQHGSCCIGGYHSATGVQSYAHATYVDRVGAFAQDVSALSHEVGEWADDPLVVNANGNNTPCGILENGDPLENEPNYGAYKYTVSGFQYNLQDLVMLPYFGAPTSTSVNGWTTFQGLGLAVCQNGS